MSYNKRQKKEVPVTEDGQVGIRATLNNMGFDDSSIGYDDKNGVVTLNGKAFMTPTYLDDNKGISYAKKSDIEKNVVDFYKGSNNPVVRVSDSFSNLAGKYGLSADALTYGNGTVSIGGKPLDIMYIDDEGKSWARENTVSDAVNSHVNFSQVKSPVDLAREYEEKYLDKVMDLYDDILNREEFSYDPEEDPVFQAYREKYLKEGNRATREAVAEYSALTGGLANSSAITAGAQANQYYASQIANAIPELAQIAYQRYAEKYQTDMGLLDDMLSIYNSAYKNAQNANVLQTSNINSVAKSNVDRDLMENQTFWDNRLNLQKYDEIIRDRYWKELLNAQDLQGLILDNTQKEIYLNYYDRLLQADLY